jgi:hypothetical protein
MQIYHARQYTINLIVPFSSFAFELSRIVMDDTWSRSPYFTLVRIRFSGGRQWSSPDALTRMPNLANWVLACLAACIIATLLVKYGGYDDQCRQKADTLVVKMVWLWIDGT